MLILIKSRFNSCSLADVSTHFIFEADYIMPDSNIGFVCSGSIVVTTLDCDPEVPGSSPEWVPIFYEARSTAQGLPEPSSLRGSTLGTSPVEHQDSDWV